MNHINTIEQYHTERARLDGPVLITSKSRGKIAVPCMHTMLVRTELVVNNLYNPNEVSPDKMDLLLQSICDNGFCFPVVTIFDDEQGKFVVIDGAHRRAVLGDEWLDCDYIPLVVLPHDMTKRLAATWQFNKARGVHQVDLDAELIRRMLEQGLSDEVVAEKLGVDIDTVHRYKQVTGIAALFANQEYSRAWEMVDD
jgi:ParB-like chromosome segregation protein Spo0J